jgi:hypothetical protein
VAGRVAERAGGNCVNEKEREKLLFGFNKPEYSKSGSPGPIIRNRVHPARFTKIGFLITEFLFVVLSHHSY